MIAGLVAIVPGTAKAASATCMDATGDCEVGNVPEDSVFCECADGSAGGGGGGNSWAGLSDAELVPICEAELVAFCGGVMPPPGLQCSTPVGDCTIDNDPEDFISCECTDGSSFGMGGGNAWAGLSDAELLATCESVANSECGGPPPLPEPVVCEGKFGSCELTNIPEDSISCDCAEGEDYENIGGSEWDELSDKELYDVCVNELEAHCYIDEGGSTGGGSTGGDTEGDTEGGTDETGAGSSEGGGTGGSEAGETEGDTGTPGETGQPGDTGATGATSDTGGADGNDGGSGGGCSVAPGRGAGGALMLGLLGLIGLGRRRRSVR